MGGFHSSSAQIVLEIKEGNGFTFLKDPVIAVASLEGKILETKEIQPSASPKFGSELIWKADVKYLKRLRISNTVLKVQCFSVNPKNTTRDRIGYILLNLKEAQIVPQNATLPELESWHRLLGLNNTLKSYKPALLLKFKVEEVDTNMNLQEDTEQKSGAASANLELRDIKRPRINEGQIPLQIGPLHLCTELYEISINIKSIGSYSDNASKDEREKTLKAHFVIFGYSFFSEDLSVDNKTNNRILLKVWSQIHFLCAYFKEFPSLMITIYSGEEIVGTGQMDLKVLSNLIRKKNITVSEVVKVRNSSELENNHLDLENELPYLDMEVHLCHVEDCISTKIDQETQSNCDCLEEKDDSGSNVYIPVPEKLNKLNSNNNKMETLEVHSSDRIINSKNIQEINFIPKVTEEKNSIPKVLDEYNFITSPSATAFHDLPGSPRKQDCPSKELLKEAAIKACEELEDWKEKEQEMFKFELRRKTERHLKKLSNEWLKQKYELEEDLKKRIEECRVLKDKLANALQDLTHRSEQLAIKEEELNNAKEELDQKYTTKFQELRKASKLHEYDMEDKINEITSEKTELLKKLEESRKEILRLQDALLNQDMGYLSKEQSANLITEIKNLEQKLEKAIESKTFFKEQWGKAVRELHRMKEEEQQHLKWQIQKNRQELQTLGLVKEISQEVGEMKKDQSTIKNIRNELSNFISTNNVL